MDTLRARRAASIFRDSAAGKTAEFHLSQLALSLRGRLAAAMCALAATTVFLFPAVAVNAQGPQEATNISIGAPQETYLGDPITVQAVLVDSRGNPIPRATVYFTAPAEILNANAEVTLAQAVTNKNGQAVAQLDVTSSGPLPLTAEFRGNAQYAPSSTVTQIQVVGEGQIYDEHVGVDIPGFNVPPYFGVSAYAQSPMPNIPQILDSLWPAMTGWPIGAALLVVWSLYFIAVTFLFRVAEPENGADESASFRNLRRSP